jgi:hypothetical protein
MLIGLVLGIEHRDLCAIAMIVLSPGDPSW